MRPIKVLFVASHPVQYASPQFRTYAADPRLEVAVAYCSLQGAEESLDPEFDMSFAWDVPLLDGYRWALVPNRSHRPSLAGMFGLVNTGLWAMIRQGRFDLVVSYLGYRSASAWIAIAAARRAGVPLVLTIDAHEARSIDDRRWKAPLKRRLLPIIFGLADGVFASSTRTRAYLRTLGVKSRVYLTPNVTDTGFIRKRAEEVDPSSVRRSWGVPEGALVALFVGKLAPWKKPADLLAAIARVPGAWGVIAGSGPLRDNLERASAELGISERVCFLGFVQQTEMPGVYAAADALVLPSGYETWGMVVNEAFAVGRPAVVSSACGSAGDLVVDGTTGFIFDPGDVDGLARALDRLDRDRELLARLGTAARERIDAWGPDQNRDAVVRASQELVTH
jgi:glycosyltransferase involved in cell wall biosynthesis